MSERNDNNPMIVNLLQRVSRLEAQVSSLEKSLQHMKERLNALDSRLWAILTGVILSILLQIALRLLH